MFNVHAVLRLKSVATWCVLGSCLLFLPNGAQSATSDSATLQWTANQEANLAGYRIYRGTNPGVYGVPTTVGKITTYQYTNLLTDKTHYFTITAFDASGNESLPSPEVKKYITNSFNSSGPPPPPGGGAPVTAWTAAAQIPSSSWTTSGWDNRSFRVLLAGSSITTSGSTVQLTLQGRTSGNYTVQRVSIVRRDGTTLNGVDPTHRQITFGGSWNAGVTVPAGGTVTSDPIPFDLLAGQDVLVTYWVPSGNPTVYRPGGSKTMAWTIAGTDQTSVIDWGSLSTTEDRAYIYIAESLKVLFPR